MFLQSTEIEKYWQDLWHNNRGQNLCIQSHQNRVGKFPLGKPQGQQIRIVMCNTLVR